MSPLATLNSLLAELKLFGDGDVTLGIGLVQIIQEATALAHHLEQSAAGTVIFVVLLQVLSEVVDPLCEQSNLNIGTAGITVMYPE